MSGENADSKPRLSLFSRDTLIIGLVTAVGYAVGVAYEAGINDYYGIPIYLMTLDATNIFIGIGATASATAILLPILQQLGLFGLLERKTAFKRIISALVLLSVFLGLWWWLNPPKTVGIALGYLAVLASFAFVELALPWFTKGNKSYWEKVEEVNNRDSEVLKRDPFGKFLRQLDAVSVLFVLGALTLIFFAHEAGISRAD